MTSDKSLLAERGTWQSSLAYPMAISMMILSTDGISSKWCAALSVLDGTQHFRQHVPNPDLAKTGCSSWRTDRHLL